MKFSIAVALLLLAMASPAVEESSTLAPLLRRGNVKPGKYIVKLKDNVVHATASSSALTLLTSEPKYTYNNVMKGFATSLDLKTLEKLRSHPDVEYIEEDGISIISGYVTQNNAVWGLARISNKSRGRNTYTYDDSAGAGVCAYSIDTGVDDSHPDFEGRAKQLRSWIQGSNRDDHGHGTHTSGTMVSKTYGVAKKANVYGFKVLDSSGSGDDSGVIAAIDAVPSDAAQRNCPKGVVVNLSLGAGFKMQAMNDAVANLVKKNIFVAAAAGNNFKDAKDESPASEPTICTVGATDSGDNKAFYSNYGSALDIQAPGSGVVSIVPGGRTQSMDGTSMASPHIAGLAAYLMAFEGVKGGAACDRIKALANKNAISGTPSGTTGDLAFNGNPSAQ